VRFVLFVVKNSQTNDMLMVGAPRPQRPHLGSLRAARRRGQFARPQPFELLRHRADQVRSRGNVAQENCPWSTDRMAILERKGGNSVSTIVPPRPTIRAADPGWIPSPLYRMTVEQYEAMVASGAFKARDRLHLINGYLVAKMTQNPPHVVADELCGDALLRIIRVRKATGRGWISSMGSRSLW
jgi:hypothetical protein